MRTCAGIFILCVIIPACGENPYPGFTEARDGVYYRIHEIGDGGLHPQEGDYVTLNFTMRTLDGLLVLSDTAMQFRFGSMVESDLHRATAMLVEGDSASFILKRSLIDVLDSIPDPKYLDSLVDVRLDVRLLILQSKAVYDSIRKREQWKADAEMTEQVLLGEYVKEVKLDSSYFVNGIYFVELESGKGQYTEIGNTVRIQYKGYFLDGTMFDDTYSMEELFEFKFGDPDQVVRGFEIALERLRQGGKAKIIIPSQLAFGEHGSSTGIVPPFTTVVYELELVRLL